ncbi:MBL fold metallo-hydrolase [Bradyrhizobium sp. CB3481]|uniref:MBL fold metallo-hydrolase n=1 Tax=Bradyrhizobium sp. CB3481 TaxID=3039158 RepID=UPI0024B1A4C5|nr:MBL fold metallo-hydrolase [Bradyrhizobium sp. CB3481]WFU18615.1 MBL fold metallo-hydrolase [Bradyrhizobium sp. CB3481]
MFTKSVLAQLSRALISGLSLTVISGTASCQEIRVTLLGTGNPPPVMNRFGPSILVEAADKKFLFDAGRGAIQRLAQIKVRWQDVDGVFFTHLHSDHVVGFPDVWLTGWLVGAGRNRPLEVWGPPGTGNMMSHLVQAFEFDVRFRISDDKARPEGAVINAHEINPGVAFEQNGMKITAIKVDHAPVEPAYGYRIDYGGRSVVLSGDTRVSENLIRAAQGVDLLVHEVASPETFQRAGVNPERAKSVVAHHVTPEQAGEVFERTKPRMALYSHIVLPTATTDDLVPPTRKTYGGPLEVGEDLMVIEVGKEVIVRRPSLPKQ